ncbi:PREDICTED: 39 kDa FK506-binding nuclear protein [Drosophila arizonae]|uniref:FK506-binding protein n=1 Tax=Drosophila arizonae TaxID=7263 RepID=A0ABM1Q5A4_DROAR|nr:PREDICTED: 39 kDa FK506-binding nuclear protein [Drosophila arizonae]
MSMFWGLSMKPNRKYTQTIVKSFHISGVALDEGDSAKVYITADKTKFIVATLSKSLPQMTLDLNFCKGDKIMFQTTGNAVVSLIGYLHDTDESDDEFEDEEEYEKVVNALKKGQKAKGGTDAIQSDEDGGEEDEDEDDDDDMDDSKLAAEYSSLLEDESGDEDDEEDDSDEDEDEDDSDEEDEEENNAAPKAKKAKINETAKKPAKDQNGVTKKQEKQQQQQKSKKENKVVAGSESKKEQVKAKEGKQNIAASTVPGGERTIAGGVKVQDIQAGNGPEAKQGKRVSVYYVGRLKSNNKTFDSMQKGNGFKFALGAGEVIKGWDVGVSGMKVGGKRRITCPAHMAYGARGHPPTIPPNSTLVFDVELKAVH